jgi:hypothetical protein
MKEAAHQTTVEALTKLDLYIASTTETKPSTAPKIVPSSRSQREKWSKTP